MPLDARLLMMALFSRGKAVAESVESDYFEDDSGDEDQNAMIAEFIEKRNFIQITPEIVGLLCKEGDEEEEEGSNIDHPRQ